MPDGCCGGANCCGGGANGDGTGCCTGGGGKLGAGCCIVGAVGAAVGAGATGDMPITVWRAAAGTCGCGVVCGGICTCVGPSSDCDATASPTVTTSLVPPRTIWSPDCSLVLLTFCPLTSVPLVEPRSMM